VPKIWGLNLHVNDHFICNHQLSRSLLPQDLQLKVSYKLVKLKLISFIPRLNCQDSCNKAYFPSLFCEKIEDVKIELNGNIFENFYKYPDPDYVMLHESSDVALIEAASETK
jgi:hypothetical protein